MSSLRPLFLVLFVTGCLSPYKSPSGNNPPSPRPIANLPPSPPAGDQLIWVMGPDKNTITSRWFLRLAGESVTLTLTGDGSAFSGTIVNGDGWSDAVDHVRWDESSGVLELRRVGAGFWQWVHARSVEGVLVGRASISTTSGDEPVDVSSLTAHVTGWNEAYFTHDIVPRTYDLTLAGKHARLRLDRDGAGALQGRFKIFADDVSGDLSEEVEYDVAVQSWDGHTLRFVRTGSGWTQGYTATATDGRNLSGTMFQSDDGSTTPFVGVRVALVDYGLVARDPTRRSDWQARTRRQLTHIMMADNPAPLTVSAQRQSASPAASPDGPSSDRDDDEMQFAANFNTDELTLQLTLADPYGGPPMPRSVHGYVTTPAGTAPAHGWPAIVVLNGHDGSAAGTLDPNDFMYWYGDAWARRGFVVLALDVGHRPLEDRANIYSDYVEGDRPDQGNGNHPAIKAAGLDSDWAEDGERVWDVERGYDWLATLGTVDMTRVAVTGLSMGAEVASFAGGLDTRFAAVIPSGATPEIAVVGWHGNHPCYLWNNGDPLDYFDVADLHALVAPRPLIVEVGHDDTTFSDFATSFTDSKELTRRSQLAYADAPDHFIMYLHPGGHEYRFGSVLADGTAGAGLETPAVTGPRFDGDLDWATDDSTIPLGITLDDKLAAFLPAAAN